MNKTTKKIRVRFAPSPTGAPHVGNIRTALFTWLFARHHGGSFILRIEDTDQDRAAGGSVETILASLDWLELEIDEGVIKSKKEKGITNKYEEIGEYGPYFQSKRLDIYQKHAEELIKSGHAYYCFCSPERLAQLRGEQEKQKQPPKYDRHCLRLSTSEVKNKLASGEPAVIRLKVPANGETIFQDVIKGEVRFKNSMIDDQVLLKSDGFPTYHLASVVDDHLMAISHVTRGEDWISSTPKHVLLYDYFGWSRPLFAHVPVILGPDKSKLSKRHGAVSILDYKEQGYLPEAMINYLALLGWNPKTNQEIFSRAELIREFDLGKINKANPIFDIKKLNWMNQQYIRKMSVKELAVVLGQEFQVSSFKFQDKAIKLAQERMEKLSDFEPLTSFLWQDKLNYDLKLLIPKGLSQTQTKTLLETALDIIDKVPPGDWTEEKLRRIFLDYCEQNNVKKGDLLWPLRVAVTGLAKSPEPFAVMDILGKEKTVGRIREFVL